MSLERQAYAPGPSGVDGPAEDTHVLAIDADGQAFIVPTAWRGRFIRWRSLGAAVYIRFGIDNTVTVPNEAAASTIGDGDPNPVGTLEVGASPPHEIVPAEGASQFYVPAWCAWMSYKCASTSLVGPWTATEKTP